MKKIVFLLSVVILFNRCAKPPNACFTHYPSDINAGDVVTFNADCSKNASYFKWAFGDNTNDTIINGTKTINHVYKTPGTFEVKLSACRKDGVTLRKGKPETTLMIVVN